MADQRPYINAERCIRADAVISRIRTPGAEPRERAPYPADNRRGSSTTTRPRSLEDRIQREPLLERITARGGKSSERIAAAPVRSARAQMAGDQRIERRAVLITLRGLAGHVDALPGDAAPSSTAALA